MKLDPLPIEAPLSSLLSKEDDGKLLNGLFIELPGGIVPAQCRVPSAAKLVKHNIAPGSLMAAWAVYCCHQLLEKAIVVVEVVVCYHFHY